MDNKKVKIKTPIWFKEQVDEEVKERVEKAKKEMYNTLCRRSCVSIPHSMLLLLGVLFFVFFGICISK